MLLTGLFSTCQKSFEVASEVNVPDNPELPDLTSLVRSSVSGFITDEDNSPVEAASVSMGGNTVTTDSDGYFEIKNVDVV